jgi:hypothetical protein
MCIYVCINKDMYIEYATGDVAPRALVEDVQARPW